MTAAAALKCGLVMQVRSLRSFESAFLHIVVDCT